MHIEKNICDSILGIFLDIEGKTKDSVKARLAMQHLGIRRDQHPLLENEHLKAMFATKSHPEGSIAEGYISEECMTCCSRFLDDVDTKLNRPERHEGAAVAEPPSGLGIFGKIDYRKRGVSIETLSEMEMQQIRHYLLTNCDEATTWATQLYREGKLSDNMYSLAQGPDHRARIYNRCFINGFLFRTVHVENNLSTQNSGVVVKGDDSSSNMDWYGVIKIIIMLDFPNEKEIVLFQCDWYDVPAANRNKGRGYKKDKYGIINIDTTRLRYVEDPYIMGTQTELVFYVKSQKIQFGLLLIKPRNLFAMPEEPEGDNGGQIDLDSLDVGVEDMNVPYTEENPTTWIWSDMEGLSIDVSVIEKARAECQAEEPCDLEIDSFDEDDDTYIDDGHVAPVVTLLVDDMGDHKKCGNRDSDYGLSVTSVQKSGSSFATGEDCHYAPLE
ncbi:LOW QUALITY PROTEIN: hypothetical protein U9M48_003458 [Paspalum notatum var. saurae]|uniref:DUF4216 domain-containing protein n=1 Tax=Paspalum notatum var. saurae TaxID=547442 RepID=A0AAQ3SGW7_PASNO